MDFESRLKQYQELIYGELKKHFSLKNAVEPKVIYEAMAYSMLSPGKYLRPVLLLAGADSVNGGENGLQAALALECIHTYSLIHDDLPCMDDSDVRRGQPACHKQFDEAIAVLAGDALQAKAFELLVEGYSHEPALCVDLVRILSESIGVDALIGGQVLDIINENNPAINEDQLLTIMEKKTAALITASILMGLKIARVSDAMLVAGKNYGYHLGVAFQMLDDILDVVATEESTGKPVGQDAKNGKCTLVTLLGLGVAKERLNEHFDKARKAAQDLGNSSKFFIGLIDFLAVRVEV